MHWRCIATKKKTITKKNKNKNVTLDGPRVDAVALCNRNVRAAGEHCPTATERRFLCERYGREPQCAEFKHNVTAVRSTQLTLSLKERDSTITTAKAMILRN